MDGQTGDEDELLSEARDLIIKSGKASASMLQRRLSLGYARAARILDELEEAGIIGPSNGAKPREILVTAEQYSSMQSQPTAGVNLHNRAETRAPENYLEEENSLGEAPDDDTTVFAGDEKNEEEKIAESASAKATADKENSEDEEEIKSTDDSDELEEKDETTEKTSDDEEETEDSEPGVSAEAAPDAEEMDFEVSKKVEKKSNSPKQNIIKKTAVAKASEDKSADKTEKAVSDIEDEGMFFSR
jgi:hypothetical protein